MPKNYDSTDLLWTSRGDLFAQNGDILDTENDPLRSLYQEVKNRSKEDQGAWQVFPSLGSSVSDYVGEPNNKQTAEGIKARILASLTRDGYINSNDIEIRYAPVSTEELFVRTKIKVMPTTRNGNSESITVYGLYRYEEDQVSFLI